ncbi:Pyruvate, phosphate dikinase [Candidatus Filomicrobium marinum]|uniref:Pyruvate, phosphate dikinase n=1 Tax=Candidatus Filomicrobium marinum TaxID=1608628 RepID=A0A0D6J9E7_9HYPH|nr:pyruvate, phosphate dikinase [Candidatus Filomicrobium marinum]CFW98069.1 Pyruvate, phosphate dikinase [Candidatus Filomicrobium marinum]CPR14838.1 Pyruvate, phosphate dikinase [Candidatus Filomicrobium marinum]
MNTAPTSAPRWVYLFGADRTDGDAGMKTLLGGKGANLAEMANLGLPVPPGFTISTDVCTAYYEAGRKLPESLTPQVDEALETIGRIVGTKFGDTDNPLLVSVRSGARASMPGMMDTILNLGLNDETVEGLVRRSGDRRFAYDSYRRFIQMYADIVLGVDHGVFEDILETFKNLNSMQLDTELTADDWLEIIESYKAAIADAIDRPFPQDTGEQLWGAISAVFGSWQNARAKTYRFLHGIPDDWGTAVNVQAMVFGNMGETSATGVAFTRNPSTGVKEIFGEFLVNAQGEDVVAGIRTPQHLTEAARIEAGSSQPSLEALTPGTFAELVAVFDKLETRYRDMQDIEFTIQDGKLWMLQTRSGKRTLEAALRIAVEMAEEGLISREEAVMRVNAADLDQLLHPTIDPDSEKNVLTNGLPASPGAAVGEIVFHAEDAEAAKAKGIDVILVRVETSPEDIHGMHAAAGILTARGGMTSHAAVVARGMGRPCVSGASALQIDARARTLKIGSTLLKEGDVITIDGSTGQVLHGRVKMRQPEMSGNFGTLMSWADEFRRLGVRANADTPRDAEQSRIFGADGIGLCRTEHMFFEADRILAMREMICAEDEEGRRAALDRILPMQRGDFEQLFETMAGLPITIRLLDPPLHEFLPHEGSELTSVAEALDISVEKLRARVRELSEFNPMLGFRGCRIAIRYPEITEMQARAVFEAAIAAGKKTGAPVKPEIMIPLVIYRREFDILADVIRGIAREVEAEHGVSLDYEIGTMVELPRCALKADEIAAGEEGAAFFSFGTNDLTQTCLGLSRDDGGPILQTYTSAGILEMDPFVSIDVSGVGELVQIGTERGRRVKPDLKIGICGEHAGDEASIRFFHEAGLDYVSCSPYRLPVARLAAAQAALREKGVG